MIRIIAAAATLLALTATVDARGLNCGRYLRQFYGLDQSYNLARNWLRLPRTMAAPGAVVVQARRGRASHGGPGGHVSRIERVTGHCTAIVRDNRGTYERNICKNLLAYVRP